jgi:hypothetical protein
MVCPTPLPSSTNFADNSSAEVVQLQCLDKFDTNSQNRPGMVDNCPTNTAGESNHSTISRFDHLFGCFQTGGACWGTQRTGGCWSERESQDHINILELRAALFALKSFLPSQTNRVVCLKMDNTTAVAYLHNMGGTHCPQTTPSSIGGLGLVREEEYISSSTAHPGQDKYGALDLTTSTTTTTSTRFDRVRGNYRSRFRFHSNVAFIAVNQQREKTFHKLNLLRTKIPYKTCK